MVENRIHVGVYGVVKAEGKITLILKGRGPYIGKLDLPGGRIEYGEDVVECLKREILEELGVEVENFKLRKVVQNSIGYEENDVEVRLQHIGIIFDVEIAGKIISRAEHDVLEAGWHQIDSLKENQITFLVKEGILE